MTLTEHRIAGKVCPTPECLKPAQLRCSRCGDAYCRTCLFRTGRAGVCWPCVNAEPWSPEPSEVA
jgi:hypothetical protein